MWTLKILKERLAQEQEEGTAVILSQMSFDEIIKLIERLVGIAKTEIKMIKISINAMEELLKIDGMCLDKETKANVEQNVKSAAEFIARVEGEL